MSKTISFNLCWSMGNLNCLILHGFKWHPNSITEYYYVSNQQRLQTTKLDGASEGTYSGRVIFLGLHKLFFYCCYSLLEHFFPKMNYVKPKSPRAILQSLVLLWHLRPTFQCIPKIRDIWRLNYPIAWSIIPCSLLCLVFVIKAQNVSYSCLCNRKN